DANAIVGRVDAAKATLAEFERTFRAIGSVPDSSMRNHMEGTIALVEKKYDLAAAKFREKSVDNFCGTTCDWPQLAQAYDLGGKPDSAIAVYERYVQDRHLQRLENDALFLGPSVKRLAELYEAKGDRDQAAKQYERFVELWKNADPELQPAVKEVRARLAKLRSAEPVKR
ncbi:MAG TPA: tetratricopeptide repeat protein, partial [Gemmatimonadaceae bacterium]|nr:tetratricopeptide repeat protein [Gemmatimonadaceae bacterium]